VAVKCTDCRRAHSDTQRAWGRARSQARLLVEVRQQLLDAIYAGQPFRAVLRDLGLTSNQVWGLTKTDEEWSMALEAALTATRRDDLEHGTNAAYARGCVCRECRLTSEFVWARAVDSRRCPAGCSGLATICRYLGPVEFGSVTTAASRGEAVSQSDRNAYELFSIRFRDVEGDNWTVALTLAPLRDLAG
jgi:hypothetical protein